MFGYYTPDEVYEAVLMRLVGTDTDWLDVGCGHELFESNPRLSQILAARCRSMTGIDPDPAVHQHRWLHHREQCTIEAFQTDRRFDLISMRMVAEHIEDPAAAVGKLGELTREGGRVVVYTVNRWSPVSLLAAATPTRFHAVAKNHIWGVAEDDTFPTFFCMNTRRSLRQVFEGNGFVEEEFLRLNDCRALARWRLTAFAELLVERVLRAVGLRYPEYCLLGVYCKTATRQRVAS